MVPFNNNIFAQYWWKTRHSIKNLRPNDINKFFPCFILCLKCLNCVSTFWLIYFSISSCAECSMGQTPHHWPAKTVFSTVPSNYNLQWTVELWAGWRGVPPSSVSPSCSEQFKIGLCWPVVWRLTFSGVGRMITCRRLNILSRENTKGKWQIQWRMYSVSSVYNLCRVQYVEYVQCAVFTICAVHCTFSLLCWLMIRGAASVLAT